MKRITLYRVQHESIESPFRFHTRWFLEYERAVRYAQSLASALREIGGHLPPVPVEECEIWSSGGRSTTCDLLNQRVRIQSAKIRFIVGEGYDVHK